MTDYSFLLPLAGITMSVLCFLYLMHIARGQTEPVSGKEEDQLPSLIKEAAVPFVSEGNERNVFMVSSSRQQRFPSVSPMLFQPEGAEVSQFKQPVTLSVESVSDGLISVCVCGLVKTVPAQSGFDSHVSNSTQECLHVL